MVKILGKLEINKKILSLIKDICQKCMEKKSYLNVKCQKNCL